MQYTLITTEVVLKYVNEASKKMLHNVRRILKNPWNVYRLGKKGGWSNSAYRSLDLVVVPSLSCDLSSLLKNGKRRQEMLEVDGRTD